MFLLVCRCACDSRHWRNGNLLVKILSFCLVLLLSRFIHRKLFFQCCTRCPCVWRQNVGLRGYNDLTHVFPWKYLFCRYLLVTVALRSRFKVCQNKWHFVWKNYSTKSNFLCSRIPRKIMQSVKMLDSFCRLGVDEKLTLFITLLNGKRFSRNLTPLHLYPWVKSFASFFNWF